MSLAFPGAIAGSGNPCCCSCPAQDVQITVDGLTNCVCVSPIRSQIVSFTGIVGNYVVNYAGGGLWNQVTIGTITYDLFNADGCGGGLSGTFTDFVTADVACVDGVFAVSIGFSGPGAGSMFSGGGALGDVLVNSFSCGTADLFAIIGTVIVELA